MNKSALPVLKRLCVGLVGLALVYTLVSGLYRASQRQAETSDIDLGFIEPDPLSVELRRCSRLPHTEALEDTLCQRAWVLNRERFFGGKPASNEEQE